MCFIDPWQKDKNIDCTMKEIKIMTSSIMASRRSKSPPDDRRRSVKKPKLTSSPKAEASLITDRLLLLLAMKTAARLRTVAGQNALKDIRWQLSEANTDIGFSTLTAGYCEEEWVALQRTNPALREITLRAFPPDVNCEFYNRGVLVEKKKIELKSSLSTVMPGSTTGDLDINQPMIYCWRPRDPTQPFEIRCGQYFYAMKIDDPFLPFQDRTPRIALDFKKLPAYLLTPSVPDELPYRPLDSSNWDWKQYFADCAINRIENPVFRSWQEELTRDILLRVLTNIHSMDQLEMVRESLREGKGSTFGRQKKKDMDTGNFEQMFRTPVVMGNASTIVVPTFMDEADLPSVAARPMAMDEADLPSMAAGVDVLPTPVVLGQSLFDSAVPLPSKTKENAKKYVLAQRKPNVVYKFQGGIPLDSKWYWNYGTPRVTEFVPVPIEYTQK